MSYRHWAACTFRIIPSLDIDELITTYTHTARRDEAEDALMAKSTTYEGSLSANLGENIGAGSFKTAHAGQVTFRTGSLPPEFVGDVCIKQLFYREGTSKAKKRLSGISEFMEMYCEVQCLTWASALLRMVYSFMDREDTTLGPPPFSVPQMSFVKAMLAVCHDGAQDKIFLVEQFIPDEFFRYIHNSKPTPADDLPSIDALERAEFLCFAQHVQWLKTGELVFASDAQGMLTTTGIHSHVYKRVTDLRSDSRRGSTVN